MKINPREKSLEPGESIDLVVSITRNRQFFLLYVSRVDVCAFVAPDVPPGTSSPYIELDEFLFVQTWDTTRVGRRQCRPIASFVYDSVDQQQKTLTLTLLPTAPVGDYRIDFVDPDPLMRSKETLMLSVVSQTSPDFWLPTGVLPALNIRALAVTPGGALLAGSDNSGAFRSIDNGDSWAGVNGLNNTIVTSFATKGTDLFLGSGGGVYRSTDDGVNWIEKINGLGSNTEVKALAIDANGNILAGANEDLSNTGGVFRSTDNGDSWTRSFNGGPNTFVNSFVFNSNGDIFAGTLLGLYRSTNQGQNWSLIASAPTNSLAINPVNGYMFGGLSQSYRSTDNGMNWQAITIHPTNPFTQSFAFNSSGHVFAATIANDPNTRNGVFRSTDFGITWEEINGGLTNTNAFSFTINSSRTLFVGTGNGVFRSINPIDSGPINIATPTHTRSRTERRLQ